VLISRKRSAPPPRERRGRMEQRASLWSGLQSARPALAHGGAGGRMVSVGKAAPTRERRCGPARWWPRTGAWARIGPRWGRTALQSKGQQSAGRRERGRRGAAEASVAVCRAAAAVLISRKRSAPPPRERRTRTARRYDPEFAPGGHAPARTRAPRGRSTAAGRKKRRRRNNLPVATPAATMELRTEYLREAIPLTPCVCPPNAFAITCAPRSGGAIKITHKRSGGRAAGFLRAERGGKRQRARRAWAGNWGLEASGSWRCWAALFFFHG